MAGPSGKKPDGKTAKTEADRKKRLAEQLRANLRKRKAQARSRKNGG